MAKILVLYHSMYGHIETMANTIAEGARSVSGAQVVVKRVQETMPADVFKNAGGKADQSAEIASPGELADYDAIIVGTPTRFGNMTAQMRNFWDQTGGLWAQGKLIGKVSSVFTSTGTTGGQEMTVINTWTTLAHHGMIIVPIGYALPQQTDLSSVKGGHMPYGASTIAGADGSRQPVADELAVAKNQGATVAKLAVKIFG